MLRKSVLLIQPDYRPNPTVFCLFIAGEKKIQGYFYSLEALGILTPQICTFL